MKKDHVDSEEEFRKEFEVRIKDKNDHAAAELLRKHNTTYDVLSSQVMRLRDHPEFSEQILEISKNHSRRNVAIIHSMAQ